MHHTKEIIDGAENKCTTCVLWVFFLADRVVQEQCCITVLEDNMCTTGINMAKDQGVCDTLFSNTCETKTTKVRLCMCTVLTGNTISRDKRQSEITVCTKFPLYSISVQYITLLDSQF